MREKNKDKKSITHHHTTVIPDARTGHNPIAAYVVSREVGDDAGLNLGEGEALGGRGGEVVGEEAGLGDLKVEEGRGRVSLMGLGGTGYATEGRRTDSCICWALCHESGKK